MLFFLGEEEILCTKKGRSQKNHPMQTIINHAYPVAAHIRILCQRNLNSDPAFGNSTDENVYMTKVRCENASKLLPNGTKGR